MSEIDCVCGGDGVDDLRAGPGAGSLVDNETGLAEDGDGDERSNDLFLLRLQSTTTMVTFQTVLARLLDSFQMKSIQFFTRNKIFQKNILYTLYTLISVSLVIH